jgi:hypothetical protein
LLFTNEGVPFTPSHAVNHGRRYRYYVERSLLVPETDKGKSGAPRLNDGGNSIQTKGWRLPAHQIEQLVLKQVAAFLRDRSALLDALRPKQKSPDFVAAVLARASKLADACEAGSFASQLELVAAIAQRIIVGQDKVTIEINRDALADHLLGHEACPASQAKNHQPITIEVPLRFRRRGVESKLVVLDQQHQPCEPDANLVKVLARAHEWFGRIVRGESSGVGDIARVEQLNRAYVIRMLRLAFLAPEIIKTMLQGRQPIELTAKRLISSALKIPLLWTDQMAFDRFVGRQPS